MRFAVLFGLRGRTLLAVCNGGLLGLRDGSLVGLHDGARIALRKSTLKREQQNQKDKLPSLCARHQEPPFTEPEPLLDGWTVT
jgi:hypothetical protein